MQQLLENTTLIILLTTGIVVLFAAANIILLVISNKRIIEEQKNKIAAIEKSEQRYKALFDNSIAGIMRFNFQTWEVLDANESVMAMFNSKTLPELQKTFTTFPFEEFYQIESSLIQNGAIEGSEIEFTMPNGIIRRYLFSAHREADTDIAQAVVVYMSAVKRIG